MSQDEDKELLKAVLEWKPPKKLHKAGMVCLAIWEEHNHTFPEEGADALRKHLKSYGDDLKQLAEGFEGATRFVMLLGLQEDVEGAERAANVLKEFTPLFEPFWERVGRAVQNVQGSSRGNFLSFLDTDRSTEKAAPKLGAAPPVGTTRLKDIVPKGRPPPWMKKDS